MLVVLAALTPLFYSLPHSVLGSTVVFAVFGLLDTIEPKRLWKSEAYEDLISLLVTFLATCLVSIETGVAIGVGLSLLVLVVRMAAPNNALLGNVPGTSAYHDIQVMEAAKPVGELFISRFDANLWLANGLVFKEVLLREFQHHTETNKAAGVRRLVLVLTSWIPVPCTPYMASSSFSFPLR
jgi:MFS superfamily sulfate permease-like transporter